MGRGPHGGRQSRWAGHGLAPGATRGPIARPAFLAQAAEGARRGPGHDAAEGDAGARESTGRLTGDCITGAPTAPAGSDQTPTERQARTPGGGGLGLRRSVGLCSRELLALIWAAMDHRWIGQSGAAPTGPRSAVPVGRPGLVGGPKAAGSGRRLRSRCLRQRHRALFAKIVGSVDGGWPPVVEGWAGQRSRARSGGQALRGVGSETTNSLREQSARDPPGHGHRRRGWAVRGRCRGLPRCRTPGGSGQQCGPSRHTAGPREGRGDARKGPEPRRREAVPGAGKSAALPVRLPRICPGMSGRAGRSKGSEEEGNGRGPARRARPPGVRETSVGYLSSTIS